MPTVFVKPGLTTEGAPKFVRDPSTLRPIPETGALVEDNRTIRRRVRDGDLVIAEPAKAPRAKHAPDEK